MTLRIGHNYVLGEPFLLRMVCDLGMTDVSNSVVNYHADAWVNMHVRTNGDDSLEIWYTETMSEIKLTDMSHRVNIPIVYWIKRSGVKKTWKARDGHVPPLLIVSIESKWYRTWTDDCGTWTLVVCRAHKAQTEEEAVSTTPEWRCYIDLKPSSEQMAIYHGSMQGFVNRWSRLIAERARDLLGRFSMSGAML